MDPSAEDERPSKRARLSPSLRDDNVSVLPTNQTADSHTLQTSGLSGHVVPDEKEIDVGITTFVSKNTVPFTAFLKKRYTDFLVNEILPNGEVVHLRSTYVPDALRPPKPKDEATDSATQDGNGHAIQNGKEEDGDAMEVDPKNSEQETKSETQSEAKDKSWISEEDKQKLISYFNEDSVSQLLALYQSILKNPQKKAKEYGLVRVDFTSDRGIRSEIHGAIRRIFSSKIDSSTDNDGTLVLTAVNPNSRFNRPNNNNSLKPTWRPGKAGWDERGGEYLHFTLYKENKDTMEAISWLVRQMKVNAKVFQFAGTKDRRAVTVQRVSAHRVDADRLASQNRTLRNSAVGDFQYQRHGLELGDLTGNEFTITLRDCRFTNASNLNIEERMAYIKESLVAALERLHTHGYLNYYGLQRFGTFATRTDTTGLHILKGDFEEACEAILEYDVTALDLSTDGLAAITSANNMKYGTSDDYQRGLAIHMYKETKNIHKALDMLPRKFSAEAVLLRHLHKQPSDHLGALMMIPRNLRLMYVHAYQSLVWNYAVTNRWSLYGSKIVEGDLVLVNEHKDKVSSDEAGTSGPSNDNDNSTGEAINAGVDADGDPILLPSAHDRSNTIDDMFERARALTASEASSGQYTIFDLVLPLPGYDVLYPSNASGEYYRTFMQQNGGLDPNDMRRRQRDFSLSGSYRKMLSRVTLPNTTTTDSNQSLAAVIVHRYRKDEEQFIKTDMEILREFPLSSTTVRSNNNNNDAQAGNNDNNNDQKPDARVQTQTSDAEGQEEKEEEEKIAAVLRFRLGSSQYATMALRELSRGGITTYKADFGGGK